MVGLVSGCRACGGRLAVTMADLGLQPASNAFLDSPAAFAQEKRYPLRAKVCEVCKLVQIDYDVAPQELFGNYVYFSSYSDDWLAHAKAYCEMARTRFALDSTSLVVELASNDGYLLKNFLKMGVPVLGIDPSDTVAAAAEKIGVPTLVEFFGAAVARDLAGRGRQADLIIGNNVLAHVPQLNDFVAGIALLLRPRGSVTIEFPHLLELVRQVEFDTIYHEHYSYFSLYAIEQVFSRHGLRLYDVERLPTHGGSLRIFAAHAARTDLKDSALLNEVRAEETSAGLAELGTYASFSQRVAECRDSLLKFLADARRDGARVAAYGAAAKGNTLLNFCGVTPLDIAFVADRNPHKQRKFLPGTHIPVVSPEELMQARPDYVLILPWNLRDEISQQLAGIKAWKGRFVTPVPTAQIYS
ncbi:MAG TPA: class I SAM-dependent methyltransferase [Steroidobacteraceae bacterium]|jgi:SAM-dependent methyltransferase|nr:class I SAM-dependent methyltransferase [Steroidobacteraceae bacterium]